MNSINNSNSDKIIQGNGFELNQETKNLKISDGIQRIEKEQTLDIDITISGHRLFTMILQNQGVFM